MVERLEGLAQPGLFVEDAIAGFSLEWTLQGDPRQALAKLAALDPAGAVIGIGLPLVEGLGRSIPGLRAFPELDGQASMPSTQYALWALVTDPTPGGAFAQTEALHRQLDGPLDWPNRWPCSATVTAAI